MFFLFNRENFGEEGGGLESKLIDVPSKSRRNNFERYCQVYVSYLKLKIDTAVARTPSQKKTQIAERAIYEARIRSL